MEGSFSSVFSNKLATVFLNHAVLEWDNCIIKAVKHSFRVFRCDSSRIKKDWLDAIEAAKRGLLHEGSLMRQATIRGKRRSVDQPNKNNPMGTSLLEPILEPKTPDESAWLSELPAELDDCIAHRDMEQAVLPLFYSSIPAPFQKYNRLMHVYLQKMARFLHLLLLSMGNLSSLQEEDE